MRTLARPEAGRVGAEPARCAGLHDADHGDGVQKLRARRALAWARCVAARRGHHRRMEKSGCIATRASLGYSFAGELLVLPPRRWQPARHRGRGEQHLWRASRLPARRGTTGWAAGAQGLPRFSCLARDGGYRFRFMRTAADDESAHRGNDSTTMTAGPAFVTSVSAGGWSRYGRAAAARCGATRHADVGHDGPHPNALALWLKRVPTNCPRPWRDPAS